MANVLDEFAQDGRLGKESAATAKTAGGRKAMRERGAVLNMEKWNKQQENLMRELVRARAAADPLYRQVLRKAARDNVALLHFDRGGAKSDWGGNVSRATGKWV